MEGENIATSSKTKNEVAMRRVETRIDMKMVLLANEMHGHLRMPQAWRRVNGIV